MGQQHYAPGTSLKSAHFASDVANFHKPYPLRHMALNAANAYTESSAAPEHAASHYDLSSSASGSAASSDSSSDSLPLLSEIEEQNARVNFTDSSASLRPEELLADVASITGTEHETPLRPTKQRRQRARNQTKKTHGKTRLVEESTADIEAAAIAAATQVAADSSTSSGGSPDDTFAEPDLGALSGAGVKTRPHARRPARAPRRRRPAHLAESAGIDDSQSVLASAPEHLNNNNNAAAPLNAEALAIAQATGAKTSGNVDELGANGPRPNDLRSVHIGQYKITPQTQFVQSIIEPSRQVLGQYFRQYLGQLQQFAGRR